MVIVMFVCLCVILQHNFLCNSNELSNDSCKADILIPPNWQDLHLKVL